MVALVSVIRTLDLTPSRDWPRSPQPTSRPWTSLTRLESSPLRRSALCRLIFDVSERRLLRWRKNVWSADASSNGATTFHYASFARASFAQMTWDFFFLEYEPSTAPFSIHFRILILHSFALQQINGPIWYLALGPLREPPPITSWPRLPLWT